MVKTTPPTSGVYESLRFCWFHLQFGHLQTDPGNFQSLALAHDKRYVEMFIYILFFPK